MALIELTNRVPSADFKLLKDGLSFYGWIKSRRRNCYYLWFSRSGQYRRRIFSVVAGGAAALAMIMAVCGQNTLNWVTAGVSLFIFSCILLGWYYKASSRQADSLGTKVIAVFDFDNGRFEVRNYSRLPFVQIKVPRRLFSLPDIEKIEYASAYNIDNQGEIVWSRIGYYPSWNGIYLYCGGEKILIFAGYAIPENIRTFFFDKTNLKIAVSQDYSR